MTTQQTPAQQQEVFNAFPAFFNIRQFAELTGVSESHVQHAARNYLEPNASVNRAKLPDGWRAIKWGKVYIVYADQDHTAMMMLFGNA